MQNQSFYLPKALQTQAIAGTVRIEVTEADALQGHEDVVIVADKGSSSY